MPHASAVTGEDTREDPPSGPPPPIPGNRPLVQQYNSDDESEDSPRQPPLSSQPPHDDRITHDTHVILGKRVSTSSIHDRPVQSPRRIVPQTPIESEEDGGTEDSDEDANSQLASSQPFATAAQSRHVVRSDSQDEEGNGSENDSPLPVLHRRSTGSAVERQKSQLGKEPYTSGWSDREEGEEQEESDHGGEALPIPPRNILPSPPAPVPPRIAIPPLPTASPRIVPPPHGTRETELPTATKPTTTREAPTLSVEGGEILDEDEGGAISCQDRSAAH